MKSTTKLRAQLFPSRLVIPNPSVVIAYAHKGQTDYREEEIDGVFSLVAPKTGEEHAFLMRLCHGLDKFAPAKGEGVLVRSYLLPPL